VWLWDLAEDRFKDAIKTLDFLAREHLHTVANLEHGAGTEANRGLMKRTTRDLAGGPQVWVLGHLEGPLSSERQRTVHEREDLEREVAYFRSHRDHLNYKQREPEGSPREVAPSSPRQATSSPDLRLWTFRGTAAPFSPASTQRRGQKQGPTPSLELPSTNNFGRHRRRGDVLMGDCFDRWGG